MAIPLWITEAVDNFWKAAEEAAPFPRDLRRPITRALPIAIVLLPELRVDTVEAWLRQQEIGCKIGVGDRRLRACLVARSGQGLIFADGTDSESELRFSIAHELAHFLIDYQKLRSEAASHLGNSSLEVLDGKRPASATERSDALLAGLNIGYHVHLMSRGDSSGPSIRSIAEAEERADVLAFELLAPSQTVLRATQTVHIADRHRVAIELLMEYFGLPEPEAVRYGGLLVPSGHTAHPLLSSLDLRP